jgi:diacylglycerol O-acyltransferase
VENEIVPLQPADRKILEIECETIAGHTCKVVRLGAGAPDVEAIRSRISERIASVPELVRRLSGEGGELSWVPFEGFDLTRRIRPLGDGSPISWDEVPAAVARLFEQRLDRERPLWQMDVGPLDDGGAVVIWRIHHALADGTAAMRFARSLLWDDPEGLPGPVAPGGGKGAEHPDDARRRRHLAAMIQREFAESTHRSPFDGSIGTTRRIAFASVPLGPLHDAAKELAGATLNDALLAIVGGALRRWLEAHHGSLRGVRVRVPVSLHHEGDSAANLDSFFSLTLPLETADPVERLRAVQAATSQRKAAHDAKELQQLLDGLGSASPRMRSLCERIEASPRSFALSVSNVPGPRVPVSLLGAPAEAIYSIAEIGERHALRVAIVSLAGELNFGFCADPAIVDDLGAMATGVEAEAAELVAAA